MIVMLSFMREMNIFKLPNEVSFAIRFCQMHANRLEIAEIKRYVTYHFDIFCDDIFIDWCISKVKFSHLLR